MPPPKALDQIGAALQSQYERWQPRARYKQSPDPTAEDVRKLCTSLRRNAKEERVLFHYNGHGVPKPTTNGEIWVFNRVSRDNKLVCIFFIKLYFVIYRTIRSIFHCLYMIYKRGWGRLLFMYTTVQVQEL